jgi:HEPN pEK499 p136
MSYLSNFEHSFSEHTLQLVQSYNGPYEATLIVNCLLGLLVVPKETVLNAIPESPLSELPKWGISENCIKNPGLPTPKNPRPETLRGLVTNLRHSVAHFRIKPVPATESVHSFEFRNDKKLHAVIPITELRNFVRLLSEHLSKQ